MACRVRHRQLPKLLSTSNPKLEGSLRSFRPTWTTLSPTPRLATIAPRRAYQVGSNYDYNPRNSRPTPPPLPSSEPFPTYFQDPPTYFQDLPPSPPPPPPPPRRRRGLPWGRMLTFTSFALLGSFVGLEMANQLVPTPWPEPDTPQDTALLSILEEQVANNELIEIFARTSEQIIVPSYSEELDKPHLIWGALHGARGVNVHRIFYSEERAELLAFVMFGPNTSGWPTFVHGGALAVVIEELSESLADIHGDPDRFEHALWNAGFQYKIPVNTGELYLVVVRARPHQEGGPADDLALSEAQRHQSFEVIAGVHDLFDAQEPYVRSVALWEKIKRPDEVDEDGNHADESDRTSSDEGVAKRDQDET